MISSQRIPYLVAAVALASVLLPTSTAARVNHAIGADLELKGAQSVTLVTFDGAKGTSFKWKEVNDPVMGGRSTATFTVDSANNWAVFDGVCRIVPSLQAPGFCNAETTNGLGILKEFNDASATTHLTMRVRSNTTEYKGFKVSFAADTLNPQFRSFKADFAVPASSHSEWVTVALPWSAFSDSWSASTGECVKCCNSTYPDVCPTAKNLKDISQIGFWAEGSAGAFHLEIQSVGATSAPGRDVHYPHGARGHRTREAPRRRVPDPLRERLERTRWYQQWVGQ